MRRLCALSTDLNAKCERRIEVVLRTIVDYFGFIRALKLKFVFFSFASFS